MLRPPLDPMLAKNAARLPAADACAGGCRYEPKWDGFRCIVFHRGDLDVRIRPLTERHELLEQLLLDAPEQLALSPQTSSVDVARE